MRDNPSTMAGKSPADPHLNHWADFAAAKTVREHPGRELFTCAAGITPSGVVHIGNFREVITVDLVARALRDHGVKVRFIYSWDDFDVFRKVPKGMPNADVLAANLRKSIVDVPDPFGDHPSYADHNIAAFESSLAPLAIEPEFIRQSKRYRAGAYAEGIATAIRRRDEIRAILNRAREATGARTMLGDDWLPLAGFCDACGRDELTFELGDDPYRVTYTCGDCEHREEVDLRDTSRPINIKLPWRIDWPMRWAVEGVCFEPGGKDHSSAGGSYDTAKTLVAEIYGGKAPSYVGYDFVRIKGRAGKISSSRGGVVTVADCLEIYEPEVLRWIFVSYKPNTEFQISFDLDVIKIYEDYDRTRRLAYEADSGAKSDKKRQAARRALQLASPEHTRVEPGAPAPFIPPFRHLSMILQIHDGDLEGTVAHYVESGEITTEEERARCQARAACAWRWITEYAPDDFRYRIREEPTTRALSDAEATVLGRLVKVLREEPGIREDDLVPHMRTLCEGTGLDNKSFLPVVYDLLLGRPKGPKVTTLVTTMGGQRALALLEPSLAAAAS
ncbi:MAG: lysine--tRNA ligase [Myxococcales bacterium]|nr:lysine--tRNA ligase [Myxococcales bacterium]